MSRAIALQQRLPGAKPGAQAMDGAEVDRLVKANLGNLFCRKCSHQGLASVGNSQGRLRVMCYSCRTTCYASTLVQQLSDTSKAAPSPGSSGIPGIPGMTPNAKARDKNEAVTMTTKLTTTANKPLDDDNRSMSVDESSGEEPEDYMTYMVEELWDHKLATDAALNRQETNIAKQNAELSTMKSILSQIQASIARLESMQAAQRTTQDNQATSPDIPTTQQSLVATKIPQKTYAQALMTKRGNEEDKPWTTVTNRRNHAYSEARNIMNKADREQQERNHYDALKTVIPSLGRSKATGDDGHAQIPGNGLVRKLSNEEMKRVISGRSSRASSPMVIIYFRGVKRNRICEIKSVLLTVGIRRGSIRNISFIGKSVMELMTFEDCRQEVIDKLASVNITQDRLFDPLSTENIKDERKMSPNMSEEDKQRLAEKFYRSRIEATIKRLPLDARENRLRNFLLSRLAPRRSTNDNIPTATTTRDITNLGIPEITRPPMVRRATRDGEATEEGEIIEVDDDTDNHAKQTYPATCEIDEELELEPGTGMVGMDDMFRRAKRLSPCETESSSSESEQESNYAAPASMPLATSYTQQ